MMITEDAVKSLLKKKHSEDVFLAECKNGPSAQSSHRRLDAWAMRRSWSNPCYIGYEIKVSRSDFLKDKKWTDYLPLCNEFYFVVPSGVIEKHEVPEQAGLMVMASTCTRLFTKKKAPHRMIEDPVSLMKYALMRARAFDRVGRLENTDDTEYWREWLERKREKQEIGDRVSQRLARMYAENVTRVERENHRLQTELRKLQDMREFLDQNNLSITQTSVKERVRQLVETGVPYSVERDLAAAKLAIQEAVAQLDRAVHCCQDMRQRGDSGGGQNEKV